MENNSQSYIITGMERKDNILSKLSPCDSILFVINSMMKRKNTIKLIKVYEKNDKLIIKCEGENLKDLYNIDYYAKIDDNKLLLSLIYIASKVEMIVLKNNIKRRKTLNFSQINDGIVVEEGESASNEKKIGESIKFEFKKKNLSEILAKKIDKGLKRELSKLLQKCYREAFVYTDIEVFGDKLEGKIIDGILINQKDKSINSNTEVKLYKLKSEKKGVEVVINNVLVPNDYLKEILNWRRSPFIKEGYTFTRLYISLVLVRDNFDLNNHKKIIEIIELFKGEIEDKVREYSREFLNDKVNINLKYDRKKMLKIIKSLKNNHASTVTEDILNEYYKGIIENQ